jgi:hypothetical protein
MKMFKPAIVSQLCDMYDQRILDERIGGGQTETSEDLRTRHSEY